MTKVCIAPTKKNVKKIGLLLVTLVLTVACSPEQVEELVENDVGGNVAGLNGTLVIRNNNSDELTLTSNGEFKFSQSLGITNRYLVTIAQNPAGQVCSVENASGVMSVVNIKDVTIVCNSVSHSVSGVVNGLSGTLVIENNMGDPITVSADGVFTFPTEVAAGAAYSVRVATQPAGLTCTVINGSGTANSDVSDVVINCAP